jgi:hypothetical protein
MDTSQALSLFTLCGLAIGCVFLFLFISLKTRSLFMGFRRLKTESDLAQIRKKSKMANLVYAWLTAPSRSKRRSDMVTAFIVACGKGNLDEIARLIGMGITVDATRVQGGKTGLQVAARNGHASVVQLLVKNGANVNATGGRSGKCALIRAAERGHHQIVKILLAAGAHPDAMSRSSGKTPLMAAAEFGDLAVVKVLLEAGADPNRRNKLQETAVDVATRLGRTEIVKLLRTVRTNAEENQVHQGINRTDQYYALLGCKKTDSIEHVRTQYRRLIKQYHPDVIQAKGLPEDFLELANSKFKLILEAYRHIMREKGSATE